MDAISLPAMYAALVVFDAGAAAALATALGLVAGDRRAAKRVRAASALGAALAATAAATLLLLVGEVTR